MFQVFWSILIFLMDIWPTQYKVNTARTLSFGYLVIWSFLDDMSFSQNVFDQTMWNHWITSSLLIIFSYFFSFITEALLSIQPSLVILLHYYFRNGHLQFRQADLTPFLAARKSPFHKPELWKLRFQVMNVNTSVWNALYIKPGLSVGMLCTMEQHALKNLNNCWNTNISFYLETSSGQNSNLYLNVVYFFNTSVNYMSVVA